MKKFLTYAATIAIAVAGLTAIPSVETASAVSPTSNLYGLNVADQGAPSGTGQYVELGSKTYFVSSTLSKSRSIWSVDGDITKEPEFLFDPFEGSTSGRIEKMWGYDKYLFFWLRDTKSNDYGYKPWALNVETKVAKELLYSDGTSPTQSGWQAGWFAENNGIVYASIVMNWGGNTKYLTFNPADMTVSDLTTSPIAMRESGNGDGYGRHTYESPAMYVVGNYLYATSVSANNTDAAQLFRYDLTANTWSDAIEYNGTAFQHIRAAGPYEYAGEKGFILSQATSIVTQPWYQNISNFQSYFVKPDGTFLRLGTWVSSGREAAPVNLDGQLYMSENYGQQVYKIDAVTGERTDALAVMFPNLTTVSYLTSMKEVGDALVFTRNLNSQDQNSGARLYSWDGVGAAVDFTDVNPPTGQRNIFDAHMNSNSAHTQEIGAVGNYAIVQLHRDVKIGFEPYYVAPNGTVTLLKDMNKATDGSDPNTECFISTTDGDWMTGNLPFQTPTSYGKDVIVSMKPVGTFLQYSIIDPGQISNPCGFTFIGQDVFFQGEDPVTYKMGIYKINPAGVITMLTEVDQNPDGPIALSYAGNYYWLEEDYYDHNLWKYDVASNTVSKLTGNNGDVLDSDEVQNMKLIGNKLFLSGRGTDTNEDDIYVADLDAPTFSYRNITKDLSSQYGNNWNLENLEIFRDKLIFSSPTENRDDPDVYEIDPNTEEVVKLFDVDSDPNAVGWVDRLLPVGNKLYINYEDDNTGDSTLRKWTAGSEASLMPLPANFKFTCVAPVGTNIVVQNEDGEAYYYGNGLNMKKIDYDFSGDNYAFCDASFTEHGSYLALPEYPYDDNGYGFGSEPGYIGPLTPIAVSRLGEPVTEGPSVPKSAASPSETTPAAPGAPGKPTTTAGPGRVSLEWTAPTTGGAVATYVVESTPAGAACEITGTTAECIGVEADTEYTFRVISTNAGGIAYSTASNSVTPLPGGGAPGLPGTPVATGKDGGATIAWTAPTDGGAVDSYIIQSSPAGANCVITGLTADCTGLNNGDIYKFNVIAVNDIDITISSTSSEIVIGDPSTMAPATPKKPTLTAGKLKITATVTPPTAAGVATSYTVYLNGDNSYECEIIAPAVSCVFENLNPDYEYSSYVVAKNANGNSNSSDNSAIYPYADVLPGAPGKPTLKAGPGTLNVKIVPPTTGGEVLSYLVTLSPGGATCEAVYPATSCDVAGLDPTVAYTATVVARNTLGSSEPSEVSSELTPLSLKPGKPAAPKLVAGPGKVTVTVTPPAIGGAATSYVVTLSPGGKTCTITAPAVKCDITGLDAGVAYTSSVVAKNVHGDSIASTSSAAATPSVAVVIPGLPSKPQTTLSGSSVNLSWSAPTTGSAPFTYTVTATPSGPTCVVTGTTAKCTGLVSGKKYTFAVSATNSAGTAKSLASSSVTYTKPATNTGKKKLTGNKAFAGFAAGESVLTEAMKKSIAAFVTANKASTSFVCVGYVSSAPRLSTDKALAAARAKAACDYIVKLKPTAKVTRQGVIPNTGIGASSRKVILKAYKPADN